MAINTYATLQTAVIDFLQRGDLATKVPTFIELAEKRFNRELRVASMEVTAVESVTGDYHPLPDDFLSARSLTIGGRPIDYVDHQKFNRMASAGVRPWPGVYTIESAALRLLPLPSVAVPTAVTLAYYAAISPLTSLNVNWLLNEYPDVYLQATMAEALRYLKDDAWAQWEQMLVQSMAALRRQSNQYNFGGPVAVRVG